MSMNKIEQRIVRAMNNIQYGYKTKDNKIIDTNNELLDDPYFFYKNYRMQSPNELLKSKYGVCWDQVELERYLFLKENLTDIKTYFLIQKNKNQVSHTFLVFKSKLYFEHSYFKLKGIHYLSNFEDIVNLIHSQMISDEQDNGFDVYEYKKPKYGISCQQFMDHCIIKKIK